MIYTEKFRTSWHDTDCNRIVRPSAILTYFEETSNLHVASSGKTLDAIRDEVGVGFILSRMAIKFYRPLQAYKNIEVDTWTSEGRAFSTYRSFRLREGTQIIAEAISLWALVDVNSRKPVKIDSYDFRFEHEEPIVIDVPSRMVFPKDIPIEDVGKRRVFYSDCDYNMHMNNTRYPDMIFDFVPNKQGMRMDYISMSFLHEGRMNSEMSVCMAKKSDDTYIFRTVDQNGNTCLEAETAICPI